MLEEIFEEIKKKYPKGTKVKIIYCADRFHPVPAGTIGVVSSVDDVGTVHVNWENGSTLGVCLEEDDIEIVLDKRFNYPISVFNTPKEWAESLNGRAIHYWVYKKMFTPYEEEEKFSDESVFVDVVASVAVLESVLPLPNGDLLLGLREIADYVSDVTEKNSRLVFHRLSEIKIEVSDYWDEEYGAKPCDEDE